MYPQLLHCKTIVKLIKNTQYNYNEKCVEVQYEE